MLDGIEAHVAAVESIGSDEGRPPAPPPLDGVTLGAGDLERATALLARLEQAIEHVQGLRYRVRGEIAAQPRSRRDVRRRAPRSVDISA